MIGIEYVKKMAEYNQWMNTSIYTAAQQLTAEDLALNRGAFFGSILGTLNHLAVSDTAWLKRFAQHPAQFTSLAEIAELPKPEKLDQILFDDLGQLKNYRDLLDKAIFNLSLEVTLEDLNQVLAYHSLSGIPSQKSFYKILWHFFNHQTHHRGQLSTLFFQAGIDVGATDLILLVPNE